GPQTAWERAVPEACSCLSRWPRTAAGGCAGGDAALREAAPPTRPGSSEAKGRPAASSPRASTDRAWNWAGGPSSQAYLQREVEAAVEVGRDIEVGAQCLQDGLQEQLPEGLQHPAGTSSVCACTPGPALLPHPGPHLLRFSFTNEVFSSASFSSSTLKPPPGLVPKHLQPQLHSGQKWDVDASQCERAAVPGAEG
ncbi:hypothetical protein MC885_013216, partial [Smutsia gigantea]